MHKALNNTLTEKGFEIAGEFYCKGLMTHSFTKFMMGGLNKGRPNEEDFKKAVKFAEDLKNL